MKYLGFTSKTIDWFGSYLKKRNIVVSLEKTILETGILSCGVLQVSILGPILFLLYVNDIKAALKNCDFRPSIPYLGSKIWNDLNQDIKASPNANSFKHALKKRFFKS